MNIYIYLQYIQSYMYILNNDSASAYQHYSSYKKEGHDEEKMKSTVETVSAIYGTKRLGSGSAESSSSREGDEARTSFLFLPPTHPTTPRG